VESRIGPFPQRQRESVSAEMRKRPVQIHPQKRWHTGDKSLTTVRLPVQRVAASN